MDAESTLNPDEYQLDGKNPRRVIPQVHRSIQVQKARMRGALIVGALQFAVGIEQLTIRWLPSIFAVVFALMLPFSIFAWFADRHILMKQKARLVEAERRAAEMTARERAV